MQKSVYFISDAHLGWNLPDSIRRQRILVSFLKSIEEKCHTLYLLGDIFDFWFEYRSVIPKDFHGVLFALKGLHELGIKLHYVAGNHDFWLGDFLTKEIGINLYFKPVSIELDSKKILIIHGDGLAPFDMGYRIMKRILRFPLNIHLYRMLHPDLGIWLAKKVSSLSRGHTLQRMMREDYVQAYRDAAKGFLDRGYDIVVMAHTHFAEIQRWQNKVYANCGNWLTDFNYLIYDHGNMELMKYCQI